ncbi:MAG: DUF423 domain-containing protein [Magnetococcales bacterium]|nr:DUF423 domain-containing protein [Magnetococcales bacterium]
MGDVGRSLLALGALNAALAVGLGAYGHHGVRPRVDAAAWLSFTTALDYHLLHALALALVGVFLLIRPASRWGKIAGGLLTAGVLLFCGSIYLKVLGDLPSLGSVTPLGGVCLMLGWGALALAAFANSEAASR